MFAVCLLTLVFSVQAQLPTVQKPSAAGVKANAGQLIGQFANALKPTSFTDAWTGQKNNFLGGLGKVTGGSGIASSIGTLAGFIKPGMFKSGFNVQQLLQSANTVKTVSQATGLLKNLEGGLKPEAFVSGWAKQRTGWLSALSLLK